VGTTSRPPKWIKPQLTRLVDEAPAGGGWLHEIKYDGYRMHARIDGRDIKLLTRTGLDWSQRYRRTIEALGSLKVKSAYLDGELCALNGDGVPVFSRLQAAMDEGRTGSACFLRLRSPIPEWREHGSIAALQAQRTAATTVKEGNRRTALQRTRCR
jgi:bifunctional non-homologous end joining protein LigD